MALKTTNVPNGIGTFPKTDPFFGAPVISPVSQVHEFFDDFDLFTPTLTTGSVATGVESAPWIFSGAVSGAQASFIGGDGGMVRLNTDSSSTAAGQTVIRGAQGFVFEEGKKLWMETKIIPRDNGTNLEFIVGLQDGNGLTAIASSGRSGVFFESLQPNNAISLTLSNGSTSDKIILYPDANGNYAGVTITLACVYDGKSTISGYLDGILVGSIGINSKPSANLAPVLGVVTASSTGQKMDIDYIHIIKER